MSNMTDYTLEISNGQRKLSKTSSQPCENAQVFIGSLNREAFEPDLMSMLNMIPDSTVHELRIMMGYDGRSRGFAFVVFEEENGAEKCKEVLHGYEFMGKKLHVNVSKPIKRLFVGSLLRNKTKQEYLEEFERNGVSTITNMIMHEPIEAQKGLVFYQKLVCNHFVSSCWSSQPWFLFYRLRKSYGCGRSEKEFAEKNSPSIWSLYWDC